MNHVVGAVCFIIAFAIHPQAALGALLALCLLGVAFGLALAMGAQNCPWCGEGTWNGSRCLTCGARGPDGR